MRSIIFEMLSAVSLLSASSGNALPLTLVSITPSPSPSLSSSGVPSPTPVFSPPVVSQRAVYFSRLSPVNNSGVWGEALIVMDSGSIGALVRAAGLAPGIQHSQYVNSGTLCPDRNADQNNDGYIDSVEAANVIGLPILSLGFSNGSFPVASEAGKLNFIQSVVASVVQPTPSPSSFGSLGGSAGISSGVTQTLNNLTGLTVVINGINPNFTFPDSVQAAKGNSDLPVACGRLHQLLE